MCSKGPTKRFDSCHKCSLDEVSQETRLGPQVFPYLVRSKRKRKYSIGTWVLQDFLWAKLLTVKSTQLELEYLGSSSKPDSNQLYELNISEPNFSQI